MTKQLCQIIILLVLILFSFKNASAQNLDKIGKKNMITVSGGLNLNSIFYHANGISNRREPFTWFANGNITLYVLDISLPFNYSYSNNQSKFTQPFNMTSFNPTYKWAKAYAGFTSMNFSPYTLAGHVFLGGGIELTPKDWKISAMYGRLKKAVAYDAINESDTDMSYKRMGYGAKVAYEKNGYGLGINYFSAKDDVTSIPYIPSNTAVNPQENTVIGISGKAKISKHVTVDGEYALSGLTKNTLVANEGLNITNKLPLIYKTKSTSQFYEAYKTSIGLGLGIVKVNFNYERVDPDYKTLGAYYFNNDFENITLAPSIGLLKGKLNIAINSGFQKNNLDQSKLSTTKRWVGSANITFAPNQKWNFNGGYSNFSSYTNVRPQANPFYINTPADTLNFYQLSQNANATISHNFGKERVKQAIVFTANYQVTGEKSGLTNGVPSRIYNANAMYSFNFTKTKTSVSIGINANKSEMQILNSLYAGPNATIGKSFFNNTMKGSLGIAYNLGYVNNITSSSVLNNRASISYNPKIANKKMGKPSLTFSTVYTQKFKTTIASQAFGEFTGTLALGYAF
jgi:hypothetical protein